MEFQSSLFKDSNADSGSCSNGPSLDISWQSEDGSSLKPNGD